MGEPKLTEPDDRHPSDVERHDRALARAGNVFLWAAQNGGHPDATVEGAAEQITAMYLRELADKGNIDARAILCHFFPANRRADA